MARNRPFSLCTLTLVAFTLSLGFSACSDDDTPPASQDSGVQDQGQQRNDGTVGDTSGGSDSTNANDTGTSDTGSPPSDGAVQNDGSGAPEQLNTPFIEAIAKEGAECGTPEMKLYNNLASFLVVDLLNIPSTDVPDNCKFEFKPLAMLQGSTITMEIRSTATAPCDPAPDCWDFSIQIWDLDPGTYTVQYDTLQQTAPVN